MPYIYDVETGEAMDVGTDQGRQLIEAGTHCWNPQAIQGPGRATALKHEADQVRAENERVQLMRLHQARQHRRYLESLPPEHRARMEAWTQMTSEAGRMAGGGRRNVS